MTGNICPKCRNAVMPYKRFLREAEPYKISACGSCGTRLRRSPKVYLFLFTMVVTLCVIGLAALFTVEKAHLPFWAVLVMTLLLLAGWTLLTSYLSWRIIGWIPADDEEEK